jgi:hypothetical protein
MDSENLGMPREEEIQAIVEKYRAALGVHADNVVDVELWADTMMCDWRFKFKDGTDAFFNMNSQDFTLINGNWGHPRGTTRLPDVLPERPPLPGN